MSKRSPAVLFTVLVSIACVLSLAGLFLLRGGLAGSPFEPVFPLRYPGVAVAGVDGRVWVLDDGGRRLSAVDAGGTLLWTMDCADSTSSGVEKPELIAELHDGTLLVVSNTIHVAEATAERQDLLVLGHDGTIQKTLATRIYDKKTRADWRYRISFVQVLGDKSTAYFMPADPGHTEFTVIPEGGGTAEHTMLAFDMRDLVGLSTLDGKRFFLLDADGNVRVSDGISDPVMFSPNPRSGPGFIRQALEMEIDSRGGLHILDAKTATILVAPDGQRSPGVMGVNDGLSIQSIRVAADGSICGADEKTGRVMILQERGTMTGFNAATLALPERIFRFVAWALLLVAALSLASLLGAVYLVLLRRRIPLILKQLIIFVPLIIGAVILLSSFIFSSMYANLEREVQNNLLFMAQVGSRQLKADQVLNLDPTGGTFAQLRAGADYRNVSESLVHLVHDNADPWNSSTYAYVYRKIGDQWYVFGGYDYVEAYAYAKPDFAQVIESKEGRTLRYDDVYGSWYSALMPIMDADGTAIAVFEVTRDGKLFDRVGKEFTIDMIRSVTILLCVLILCFGAFTWFLLLSLGTLRQGAVRLTEGDYDVEIGIHSRDELEDLGTAFNRMSGKIRSQISHITRLNESNARFVPTQFLTCLGKESILDIQLGDHSERVMTVLFSDIRDFTGLSERMSPRENFEFINEYLAVMGPVIRRNNGFIDKYIGDAIMALFPESPAHAIRAALEMAEGLEDFNKSRGDLPPIQMGTGIHTGRLMMGIVGELERYEGTVIADVVNLASRLEGLTKQYGVSILASEDTLEPLRHSGAEDLPDFNSRFLDLVRVKGKHQPSSVFEIISPLDPLGGCKTATRDAYRKAFDLYRGRDFAGASLLFEGLLQQCPHDKAMDSLLRRCRRLESEGTAATWDGIIELRDK